jgi:hypothetical protein
MHASRPCAPALSLPNLPPAKLVRGDAAQTSLVALPRPPERCPDHALDERVFEQSIGQRRAPRRHRNGGAKERQSEEWSASYLWAHDARGRLPFLLRVGPPRVEGGNFCLRYALDHADRPRAVLTSHRSHCELSSCRPDPARPQVPEMAVALADSPVAAHHRGWNVRGEKVWITRLFDADVFDLLEMPLSPVERQLLCYRTAQAALTVCARLHPHDIGHGDIKAENFFWSGNGDVVLGDFDLAFTSDPSSPAFERRWRGTPTYMAPEAHDLFGQQASVKSDLFSLGLTLMSIWSPERFDDFVVEPDDVADVPGATALMPLDAAIEDRHALLSAWLKALGSQAPAAFAAHCQARWGPRWRALTSLSQDLWSADPALARLICFGLLPLRAERRGEAGALLDELEGLIDAHGSLANALGVQAAGAGPSSPTPRQAYEARSRQLFARLRGGSPDSELCQRDLARLGQYDGHGWFPRVGAVSPRLSLWLAGLEEPPIEGGPAWTLAAWPAALSPPLFGPWLHSFRCSFPSPMRWAWDVLGFLRPSRSAGV